MPGFLVEFVTPIVRVSLCHFSIRCRRDLHSFTQATKGKQKIDFFTLIEFQKWNEENNADNKWSIKYYKVRSHHCCLTCVVRSMSLHTGFGYFGR